MQRPIGVSVTAILMFISLLTETAINFGHELAKSRTDAFELVIFQAIAAMFVWFYLKGYNWARWLVMLQSVLCILLSIGFVRKWHETHVGGLILVHDAILGIFLLWYLNTRGIKSWFWRTLHK